MKFQMVILCQKFCTLNVLLVLIKLHERLADHQNKTGTIHQKNIPISGTSMKIMKGRILAIKEQVKLKLDQLIFNQIVLKSVIETIIFCGCKTLSLTR